MGLPPRLFRLPVPAILALRYLRSSRKDSFVTFLSLVAGVGLALGVAVLILALGALSGFQRVLLDQVLARTPQVEVELPVTADAATVAAAEEAVRALPGVRRVWRVVRGQGWVVPRGRRPLTVEMVGFEGSLPMTVGEPVGVSAEEAGGSVPVDSTADGAWLPADFAAGLGLAPGDRVEIASPRPTLTPMGGPRPRLRSVAIAGWFEPSGEAGRGTRVALPRAVAESLLTPTPSFLEIDAGGLERASAVVPMVTGAVEGALGGEGNGARVVTWRQLEAPLFFVLRLEKAMMFVAISLIVLVASLALVASLSLVIANKRSEIGMLGAMGATPGALERTFLLYGGVLVALGAGAGALLGITGAWALDHWQLLSVPGDVYFVNHVPFRVLGRDLALVLAVTLGLALAAALYAARRAAALTPVEAIRR